MNGFKIVVHWSHIKEYNGAHGIYYRPQRSWGKVIFSIACVKNSVHRGGVPGQVPPPPPQAGTSPLGRYTPRQVHLPGRNTPQGWVHPPCRYTHPSKYTPRQVHPPWGRYTPPGRYIPPWCRYTPRQVHPTLAGTPPGRYTPPQEQCMLGDTGNKRAVRILLECILVLIKSKIQKDIWAHGPCYGLTTCSLNVMATLDVQ